MCYEGDSVVQAREGGRERGSTEIKQTRGIGRDCTDSSSVDGHREKGKHTVLQLAGCIVVEPKAAVGTTRRMGAPTLRAWLTGSETILMNNKVAVLLSCMLLRRGKQDVAPLWNQRSLDDARSSAEQSPAPITAYWINLVFRRVHELTESPSAPSSQKCATQPSCSVKLYSPTCFHLQANRLGWLSSSAHGFVGFSVGDSAPRESRGIYRNCTNWYSNKNARVTATINV
jgi:hypothetical protein